MLSLTSGGAAGGGRVDRSGLEKPMSPLQLSMVLEEPALAFEIFEWGPSLSGNSGGGKKWARGGAVLVVELPSLAG